MSVLMTAAAVVLFAAALGFAAPASAAGLKNGNFEKGTFSGWKTESTDNNDGRWYVADTALLESLEFGLPKGYRPKGKYAAVALQPFNASAMVLYRNIKIPRNAKKAKLSFTYAYISEYDKWFPKPSLKKISADSNQQFRIDLLKASGNPWTLKKGKLLKSVVRSKKSSPLAKKHSKVKVNLKKWAGKKVRIRYAVAVNEAPVSLVVDNVKLKIKK